MAYTPAVIISPAPSATACTSRMRPLAASATSLTTLRVSRFTIARGTARSGSTRQAHATPDRMSSASVRPADAIAGLVNVTRGRAE